MFMGTLRTEISLRGDFAMSQIEDRGIGGERSFDEPNSLAESIASDPPETHTNGKSKVPPTSGAKTPESADATEPSSLDRVEEMMDEVGRKVGEFTSKVGKSLFMIGSHLRENFEDVWAEANELRKKNRNDPPST
jgi:hypothetical protein